MRNWRLEHVVRLTISVLVMLATVLLAIGEQTIVLPLLTLLVLGVSAYVTDFKRWFHLKQPMADLLALSVVALSGIIALRSDRQGLLVSVANLQSYLQYVVLFQPKTPRICWQLALLSLGQVAIASALVPGMAFGFMVAAFVFVAIFAFAVMLLQVESTRLSKPATSPVSGVLSAAPTNRRPQLSGEAAPLDRRTIVRGLLAPVALVGSLSIVAGSLLFFALPRWETSTFRTSSTEPLRTVGFSNTVLLGELGEVIENPDLVMRIQFFRGRGNTAIKLEGEPLFRGSVVTRYENRKWSRSFRNNPVDLPVEAKGTIVRQKIWVEPLDVSELFCIFPVFALDSPPDPKLRINTASDQLIRRDEYRSQTLEFEVGTTGITGNRQRDLVPCESEMSDRMLRQLTALEGRSDSPEDDPFSGLRALAARVVAEQNIDPQQDPAAAARALSDYFHLSGEFFYSFAAQPRNAQLDPLEDFVTEHRGGHCEYFAGALVLMLRSLDIPARMAIGFKGGEWNPLGMYYQVQQLHAHAWVEVYLRDHQIPPDELASEAAPNGAWLVLDPTEGTLDGGTDSRNDGLLARIRQSVDYAHVLWINYVATLNSKRQRQGIYEPLAAGFEAAVENLTSEKVWGQRYRALQDSRAGKFWRWYRRHWFSWRGGLVAVGFSLLAVGIFLAARSLVPMLISRLWSGRRNQKNRTPVLEMYRRLEAVLRRVGLARHPAQTAREFAVAAGGELSEHLEYRRVAHLPRRVVDSFYRVRFGRRALDSQEAKAVEQALRELERTLARGYRG